MKKSTTATTENFSKCVICGKPLKKKGWYCNSCIIKTNEINKFLSDKYNLKYPVNRKAIAIISKEYCPSRNVFDYIRENPQIIFSYFSKTKQEKEVVRKTYQTTRRIANEISMNSVPKYILYYFWDNEDKTLIDIRGTESDPKITCKCVKCGRVLHTDFNKLRTSNLHYCDYHLSNGEFLVKKYLESINISFVTQRDTLQCTNPKTSYILPYDFEIKGKKIIIEVQGEQHFKYVPVFHINEEGFRYQQYKDKIKKQFALKNGYTYLEITYADFNNGRYKDMIYNAIQNSSVNGIK